MSKNEILEEIKRSGNRIFNVRFIKKDGSLRNMNCRLHVKKGVKGVGMRYEPLLKDLLVVYDMNVNNFRMVNLNTIIGLKVKGIKVI